MLKLGPIPVAARGVCFSPNSAPNPGEHHISMSLPGLSFIKKIVTVNVPKPPVVTAKQLKDPVPITKRLVVALTTNDIVFTYRLTVENRTITCENIQVGIGCSIEKLGLSQGSKYTLKLDRYFKNKKVKTVLKTDISTLPAVTLVSSSIKQNEVVYAKPKSMSIAFDKPIKNADIALVQINGDKRQTIPIQKVLNTKEIALTWTEDLTRESSYEVILTRVQAEDGSTLMSPSSIVFKTSGGPKVKNISVGTYKVAVGAVAVLTFDQPISDKQDINQIITTTGGARIINRSGATVSISFASVPRCTDVDIKVTNELRSNYDVAGGSAWQFSTRTTCQIVGSIGTSVKGRSITSYTMGNGANTVVYTGGIHGDELSTRSLMLRWIDYLEANIRSIPADKRVVVIPSLNPDGVAIGSRTNARNVDLNRNFNTSDWQTNIMDERGAMFAGGGGPSPLSEPESAAIASFIANVRPSLVVSYHSIGGLIMANQTGNSFVLAKTYASLSGYGNSTGVSTGSTFGYSVSGTADDYYGEKLGIASLLIELGSHTHHQFERNQRAMMAVLKGA